jgi:hypothetical protein
MMMIFSRLLAQNLARDDDDDDDSNCCLQIIKNDAASNTSTQKNNTRCERVCFFACCLCLSENSNIHISRLPNGHTSQ